jgi:aspartyl-tRNA synthetase
MKRTYINELSAKEGQTVLIQGWVHSLRGQSKIKFLQLRDITGVVQAVAFDSKLFDNISKLLCESVVSITGLVKKAVVKSDEITEKNSEIEVKELEIINLAEPLPITIFEKDESATQDLPKRLDYRFLDFHRRKTQAVFKIQNEIANAFREHFYSKGFLEMQPPCIISAASEGGTDLFSVQYFEKKAYLAQSPQLYKQMLACSVEKTFTITPVWRAEKHNTPRHINEIRQMDIECAFMNQMEVMQQQEEAVKDIIGRVLKNCSPELEILGVKNLKVPKGVYLPYERAIKEAGGKPGDDFTPEQERILCDKYKGDLVFTHSWPAALKPFYIMPKDGKKEAKVSEGFDSLYGGVEISSGGQRIHLPELLIARIKAKGLNPDNFKSYIDSFRYGAPYHSGWSIGLERLTQMICGLDNVKEATMFPRDRDRLTP